jgi:hypothetical protein
VGDRASGDFDDKGEPALVSRLPSPHLGGVCSGSAFRTVQRRLAIERSKELGRAAPDRPGQGCPRVMACDAVCRALADAGYRVGGKPGGLVTEVNQPRRRHGRVS